MMLSKILFIFVIIVILLFPFNLNEGMSELNAKIEFTDNKLNINIPTEEIRTRLNESKTMKPLGISLKAPKIFIWTTKPYDIEDDKIIFKGDIDVYNYDEIKGTTENEWKTPKTIQSFFVKKSIDPNMKIIVDGFDKDRVELVGKQDDTGYVVILYPENETINITGNSHNIETTENPNIKLQNLIKNPQESINIDNLKKLAEIVQEGQRIKIINAFTTTMNRQNQYLPKNPSSPF